MKNPPSWQDASKVEWKEACRRETVIRPLVEGGLVSNARVDQAAEELGISRSLVYRLVARCRRRAQTSSLLSVSRGRPKRSQSLDERVEALVRSAVERIYLQREQPRVSDLLRIIKIDCQRLGLKPPAYNGEHFKPGARKSQGVVHLIGWSAYGTPGADRETIGNRDQSVLSGVCRRSMGRATGGLRGTTSIPGSASGCAVASQRTT
jgi:hypothetical protein